MKSYQVVLTVGKTVAIIVALITLYMVIIHPNYFF